MNNLTKCDQCGGKCCCDLIDVYPTDDLWNKPEFLKDAPEGLSFKKAIKTNESGMCMFLESGKCTIYDTRPQVCRRFKVDSECCNKFFNNTLTIHECRSCKVFKST